MRNPLAYILYYTHIILEQVSTTLLPEGHINYYIALRWLDILRNVIVSGYVTVHSTKSTNVS